MIYDEQTLLLDEKVSDLVAQIVTSADYKAFLEARAAVATDPVAQGKMQTFLKAKEAFERVKDYGAYAPDLKEKQIAVYREKRSLDLLESVAQFRQKETQLQNLLDEITKEMAQAVSNKIKIDAGNPFFDRGHKPGCKGSQCHAS